MTKARFIQHAAPIMLLAQLLRGEGKADPARAIAWAESLWERIAAAGYGAKAVASGEERGPRVDPKRDALGALPPELAESFARLWKAYAWPKGKQAAAQRWGQLAPGAELAERIIAAAGREAREPRPEGAVRKWLQGWLSERRWEDQCEAAQDDAKARATAERRAEVAELLGEWRRLSLHLQHAGEDAESAAALQKVGAMLAERGISPGLTTPAPARSGGGARKLKDLLRTPSGGATNGRTD